MTPIRRDYIINTERKFSDVAFLFLFLLCVFIWIVIDIYGYSKSNNRGERNRSVLETNEFPYDS